jgi:hypothetical protein
MQPGTPRSFLIRTGLLLAGLVCCTLLYAVTAQPRTRTKHRPRRLLPGTAGRNSSPDSLAGERGQEGKASGTSNSDDGSVCTPDSEAAPLDGSPVRARQQHLAKLGVEAWHAQGHKGKGFKVAILDSGFRGYKNHQGKTIPAQLTVKSFRLDGNLEAKDSQHGILCGEVIHALAPEAELLLANWEPDQPGTFLDAVKWARQQGARIITCSVIMPTWSDGEGSGPVHEQLRRLLGDGTSSADLLFFASAGNTAQRHWCGPFRDAGDGSHVWANGVTANVVQPWNSDPVSVELCCPADAEYELRVEDVTADRDTGRQTAHSLRGSPGRDQSSYACAVVRFDPALNHVYAVHLGLPKRSGAPSKNSNAAFHLTVLGGGLRHATPRGSIPFPGDGPEVVAVAAVDAAGKRALYSSCGPNSSRPKPDLAAQVPFPSLWRTRPFSGTSAAAPQAAGLAALLWARHPDWTARQVRETLQKDALDLGEVGHDCETGYGLARLK